MVKFNKVWKKFCPLNMLEVLHGYQNNNFNFIFNANIVSIKFLYSKKLQLYHDYTSGYNQKITLMYQDFKWLNLFPHTLIIWFGCRGNVVQSCEVVTKTSDLLYGRKSRSLKELINNESCDFKLHALPT